jgi:hypothetical protein
MSLLSCDGVLLTREGVAPAPGLLGLPWLRPSPAELPLLTLGPGGGVDLVSACNLSLACGSNLSLTGAKGASLAASGGDLSLSTAAGNVDLQAACNVDLQAACNVDLACGSNLSLTGATWAYLGASGGDLDLYGACNLDLYAASNLSLGACSNPASPGAQLLLDGDGATLGVAYPSPAFPAASLRLSGADQLATLTVAGTPVLEVSSAGATLQGDLQITGAIKALTTASVLQVEDKVVRVAYSYNPTTPEPYVDGSGMQVCGNPGLEKSLLWRFGAWGTLSNLPADQAGTLYDQVEGGLSNEGFWELRGGGLRLTVPGNTVRGELGFGVRVDADDNQMLYRRRVDASGSNAYRVLMVLGSTADPGDLPL